jgi:hypothetical protein
MCIKSIICSVFLASGAITFYEGDSMRSSLLWRAITTIWYMDFFILPLLSVRDFDIGPEGWWQGQYEKGHVLIYLSHILPGQKACYCPSQEGRSHAIAFVKCYWSNALNNSVSIVQKLVVKLSSTSTMFMQQTEITLSKCLRVWVFAFLLSLTEISIVMQCSTKISFCSDTLYKI